jgi:hypothetical protein
MKAIAMGVLGGLVFGFAMQVWSLATQIHSLRGELIEKGIAEWVADKNGNTTFQLKEGLK